MSRGDKPPENRWAGLGQEAAAFGFYALLSVVATWPVVLRFATEGLGEFYLDRVQNVWNLWWVKVALLDRHTNPFQTDLLLYPQGADLYFHTLNLPSTLLSLPVQLLAGPTAAYNFSMMLALALSGYAGYRLVRYLTGSAAAGLIGGIIIGFNPLSLFELRAQLQILSLQWMILCIEFYLRAWNTGRGRDGVWAGLFFTLALLTVGYFEVFLAIFFALHLLWALVTGPGRGVADRLRAVARRAWGVARWAGPVALLTAGPYLLGAVLSLRKGQVIIPDASDLPHSIAESSDLLSFLVPNRDHWLLGGAAPWWPGLDPAIHDRTYLGLIVVALALMGGWTRRKEPRTWLWVALVGIGVVLALGPVLQFNHQALGPAPLSLLDTVPPFSFVRGPERFATLAYLGLAVLAGWGILDFGFWILERRSGAGNVMAAANEGLFSRPLARRARAGVRANVAGPTARMGEIRPHPGPRPPGEGEAVAHPRWGGQPVGASTAPPKSKSPNPRWLAVVTIALLLLDLPLHSRVTEAMPIPPALAALGRDPAAGALLEFPFTQHGWIDAPRMLYQIGHGRPITSGYLSRHIVEPYTQACALLQPFARYPRLPAADIVTPTATTQLPALLREAGVGFIAIYKIGFVQADHMSPLPAPQFNSYAALAGQLADPAYEDDTAKIYRVRPGAPPLQTFLQLGPDWYDVEQSGGQPFRWINGEQADLCITSAAPSVAPLTLAATSFATPRHLQVWVNDRQVLNQEIPADGALHPVRTPPLAWPAGPQRVRLVIPEGSTSPADAGQGGDTRQLSLGISAIRLGEGAP